MARPQPPDPQPPDPRPPDLRRFEREVIGFPVVPPGRATRVVNALRRRLLGTHRRTAPPALQILEGLYGLFDNRALGLLCELDIPDLLDVPRTIDDLAERTGTDPDRLARLLRFAAARGFCDLDRRGRVRPNGVTRALRSDAAAPWHGWVAFASSDWFWAAWRHLDAALRPDGPPGLDAATGHDFFTYVNEVNPDAGGDFNRAMQAGATLQGIALAHALDWSEVRSVCDIGGGTGATVDTLRRYHPDLDVTLFDLPNVVGGVAQGMVADVGQPGNGEGLGSRTVIGGDFFDHVPSGHDRYLLLAVVHDWDDAAAVAILRNVRTALPDSGRAVVVENVLAERAVDDFATATDLLMLTLATGRERTEGEYEALFTQAGLAVAHRHLLASGATAFELRPIPGIA